MNVLLFILTVTLVLCTLAFAAICGLLMIVCKRLEKTCSDSKQIFEEFRDELVKEFTDKMNKLFDKNKTEK